MTRHNAGIVILSAYCGNAPDILPAWKQNKKIRAETIETTIGKTPVVYARSLTYMNESGIAAAGLLKKYGARPNHMLVIHDDSDLATGRVKFTTSSRSAGHHGVESIMRTIKTQDFPRLRIGIRPPESKDKSETFVLKRLRMQEQTILQKSVMPQAARFITSWLAS